MLKFCAMGSARQNDEGNRAQGLAPKSKGLLILQSSTDTSRIFNILEAVEMASMPAEKQVRRQVRRAQKSA